MGHQNMYKILQLHTTFPQQHKQHKKFQHHNKYKLRLTNDRCIFYSTQHNHQVSGKTCNLTTINLTMAQTTLFNR